MLLPRTGRVGGGVRLRSGDQVMSLARLIRTPHKDEATEAEDAEWDPDDDEDPRVK